MTAGLGNRAVRGAAVSLGGQVVKGLVQIGGVVVLARLLTPRDYGLLAMVTVVVGVGDILRDFGLSTAAVRAPTLSRGMRDNLFWLNTLIGLVLAGATVAIGPLVSGLMHQAALTDICRWLSLTFVLNGVATQYRASLERDLRFKATAVADAVSPVLALAVAVLAALAGWGYWALVAQALTLAGSMLVLLVVQARWLPRGYDRREPMRPMLVFGGHMVASQLVGYVSNNTDTFTVGIRFGSVAMGLYNRGFQLLMQPYNQVRVPVTKVAVPVLGKLHDDPKAFSRFLVRGQLTLGYTLCLALAVVAGVANPLTLLLLGPRWDGVGPIVALFAIAAAFQTLALVAYWVYVTKGLTGHLFRYSLMSAAVRMTCILVGSLGGVLGVAAGYAVGPILLWPISFWWLAKRSRMPLPELYGGAGRIAVTGVVAGGGAWVTQAWWHAASPLAGTAVGVVGAVVAVAVLTLVARPVRRDLTTVAGALRHLAPAASGRAGKAGPGRAGDTGSTSTVVTPPEPTLVMRRRGTAVPDVGETLDVLAQTLDRAQTDRDTTSPAEARRLRALEQENARLKRIVADQALDLAVLKGSEDDAR